ncbi:MAG: Stp1/IreP family PP2C-type Ser/Thr phosphatase [Acutalibacter sp.]|nr:Stp1/IreP family PP2C-type Ser/Thr phosphatase [Acutalibacter sp.]
MKVDYSTDVGAIRESNQDSCECGLFSSDSAWVVVCDGMGGANGGNVASEVAAKKIKEFLIDGFEENMSRQNIKSLILNAINRANDAVYSMSLEQEELRGMGTTAVVLVATKGLLHVAHVGDSRAYLKNEEGLSQITMDHSFVQDLVNMGQITPEEARVHPQRNIITRALGAHEVVQCDYSCFDFSPGDVTLACSDGLSNYVDEELLLEYINKYEKDEKTLVESLTQYAVESGGSDNITVAVIKNG